MLKIHPIYRIYDYSHHKAMNSLLKAGFIKEDDIKNLEYHDLHWMRTEGKTRLYSIDTWSDAKLYTLEEIYKMYSSDFYRFCVTICYKDGDYLCPTGLCTFRMASARMCVQADVKIVPYKMVHK